MKMHGPVSIEIQIMMTDGEQFAEATYSCPIGIYPKPSDIEQAMEKAVLHIRKQMKNENWRLVTKQEFWDEKIAESTGTVEKFAMPGGEEWDKPE